MRRWPVFLAALCALFSVAFAQEGTVSERYSVPQGESVISFRVGTNGVYEVAGFGMEGAFARLDAPDSLEIWEAYAQDDGRFFSMRLTADTPYTLTVNNPAGEGTVEIMRSALGRSFFDPLTLSDGYVKAIVAENDVHWYRFTPMRDGLYTVRAQSDMDTAGVLLDGHGNVLAENDDCDENFEKDFLIRCDLKKGQDVYLRIRAKDGGTGAYTLRLVTPESGTEPAKAISLSETNVMLDAGDRVHVRAVLSPENALQDIVWMSCDPSVATVDEDGGIRAVSAGETDVIAQTYGTQGKVHVTVRYVPVAEIRVLSETEITLPSGSTSQIACMALPEDASVQKMVFASEDTAVAEVDGEGTVTAVGEGVTHITVTSGKGEAQTSVTVYVTKALPVYRVLAVGIQQYDDGRERVGATNTTQGIADMFGGFVYESGKPEVSMRIDTTRAQLLRAIARTFAQAKNTDISVLYINCHGGAENGAAYLEMRDGKRITAGELYRALQKVNGRIVLLLDCCKSGAFLTGSSPFAFSKYTVITSASDTQDSYRMSFDGANNDSAMSTVFARSFTESGGWSIVKDRAQSLAADTDHDRIVYVTDAFRCTETRVKEYLAGSGVPQDVQLHPENARWVLFRKE